MDKSVTISVKGVLLAGAVLVAMLAAYLVGGAGSGPGGTARADDGDGGSDARRMTMVGTGTATAVPDQISFTVSVSVLDPELETALGEASETMKQVLARLKDHGVTAKDMQTTGLSMNPEYDYPNYGAPVLKGYRVKQSARVLVPELKQGGKAITAAVDAGGNRVRVSNISLGIADRESVLAQARTSAVEEATTKAEEYAEASGQDLGDVVTLKEVSTSIPRVEELDFQGYSERAALSAAKTVPIRAGEDELKVRIQVVWELG
ncbi:SIMPL domain-containing protein [Nocardioides jensenii]|uniref:SIMPL domain-containing protein n=1 Tax=Nocardioides jensenii TaxID=1843 RepID=UPI0008325C68|nr:SIMPL domain-containing protein [Nocardioides jensenii]